MDEDRAGRTVESLSVPTSDRRAVITTRPGEYGQGDELRRAYRCGALTRGEWLARVAVHGAALRVRDQRDDVGTTEFLPLLAQTFGPVDQGTDELARLRAARAQMK